VFIKIQVGYGLAAAKSKPARAAERPSFVSKPLLAGLRSLKHQLNQVERDLKETLGRCDLHGTLTVGGLV